MKAGGYFDTLRTRVFPGCPLLGTLRRGDVRELKSGMLPTHFETSIVNIAAAAAIGRPEFAGAAGFQRTLRLR